MTTTWKCLNSRFVEDGNTRQQLSFSFPELWYSPLEFNFKNICQHLTKQTRWNKRDKVWSSANSLFNWRFRSRRLRGCLCFLTDLCGGRGYKATTFYFFPELRYTSSEFKSSWNNLTNYTRWTNKPDKVGIQREFTFQVTALRSRRRRCCLKVMLHGTIRNDEF